MSTEGRALVRGPPLIALAILLLFSAGYAVTGLLGLAPSLGLPLWLRLLGGLPAAVGLAVIGWTVRVRGFREVVVSTYITFLKFATGTPLDAKAGREEPLVITGPYRYVRSPLYFGAFVLVLGLALLTSYTFVLVTAVVLFVWFRGILIRYEEKELRALFGSQFEQYEREVPTIIPFTKVGRRPKKVRSDAPPA